MRWPAKDSGSEPDNFARILKNVFGAKVKLVTGYPGGSEMNLAIERGEVDGRCGWSWDSIKSTRPDWLRDQKINLLAVFSLQKAADIPADVPLIVDLAANEEQRQILRMHLAGQSFGRPFFTSPGLPEDRKAALRAAFDATMSDPDFVAETNKVKLEVSPTSGADIDRLLAEVYATPKDVIEKAKNRQSGTENSSGQGSTMAQRSGPFLTFFMSVVRPPCRLIHSFTVSG